MPASHLTGTRVVVSPDGVGDIDRSVTGYFRCRLLCSLAGLGYFCGFVERSTVLGFTVWKLDDQFTFDGLGHVQEAAVAFQRGLVLR